MGDKEEREQELEALEAIFGDELERLSDDAFEISITTSSGKTVTLRCSTPEGYPSRSPPLFELDAPWLSQEEERFMCEQMEGMFVKGEVVVYIWAEWIREFVYEPGEAEELAEAANQKQEEEEQEEWGDEGGVEYEFIEEAVAFGEDGSEWADRIVSGETTVDRKSVFQTHMATVRSVDEVEAMKAHLMTNNKIKRATHNIMAYRVHTAAGVVSGDCDDDGEDAAGGRLLHLLSILDARDVCVVVSRWYGGIHLGPDRFKHINNSARTLMMQFPEKWGRTDGAGGKCAATAKGKKGKH